MPASWPASVWNSAGALCVKMSPMKDMQRSLIKKKKKKSLFALFCMKYVLGSMRAVLASAQPSPGSQREY